MPSWQMNPVWFDVSCSSLAPTSRCPLFFVVYHWSALINKILIIISPSCFAQFPGEVETRIGDVVNASFGGSADKGVRAILYTSDDKVHLTKSNFFSSNRSRKVTTLKNTVFAALSRDDIIARLQRANGDGDPELIIEPIYPSDSSIGRSTKEYPSLKNTVFVQWMHPPSEELLFVVEENSRYLFYLWHPLRGLKLKYTTCTFGGEGETVLSDFILSSDGNHCLLLSDIGAMLFPSKPGTHGRVTPSEVMDVEAATFMEVGGSGTSPVLITAKYEHLANERPAIKVKARELLPPDSDNTPQQLVQKISAGMYDGPVRLIQFSPGRTEGIVLTKNALKVMNIDPSLRHLTAVSDPFFVLHDISGAVYSRSGSGSSPDTLYALAYSLSDRPFLCSLEVLRDDTTSSESSVTSNHSTLSNENETLSTSRNNGLEPLAPHVSVASPSTTKDGRPDPSPSGTSSSPEKLGEGIVSDSQTTPQNNSERGVDVPPSTRLVTQRSQREFTTTVSLGMDPPIDQSDGSGNTQQAEKVEDLSANKDIGLNTMESLHSSSLKHEVGTEISMTDALAVDSGEQETPLRSPTRISDAPAPDSSKSEGPTTNGNANTKAIVNPFEVEDDDATKSSRSSSPAASADKAGGEAKTIGALKSAVDDGLKDSQLSSWKRAESPSTPLPSPTKPSSFERDNASVASDGSKAIESTTTNYRFEDTAKVGVPPQDRSAINGDILPSPEKQTPRLRPLFFDVEEAEAPVHPPQDRSINSNAAKSDPQPLGGFDSSLSSSSERDSIYDADEEENEDDDNEEGDVDQDSAEESSFSDHDQDGELERDQDSNALSEDEQVVAATPQRLGEGLVSTGTNSDSDKTVPWNSADAARQQLNLQSLDESSEDNEDLDEDAAEKSSGENGRVLNVASPAAVAKMEVISISSGSPTSDGDDGFIVDETEKATIHAHVDTLYQAFNIIHPNEQMTVEHTQCLVAQRLGIDREALSQEQENLVRQRVEHWLGGNNDYVENEVAGETGGASALENHQGSVPRGGQNDSGAISVYSSYDYDVSSSTDPTEHQILDFVDSRFEIADLDKMTRKDFQRQAVKHFFGLEDRNALGDDRKQMIKVRVNELLARTSTQRESLEDEDDELLVQNDEDEDDAEFELEGSEEESDDATERMEHLLRGNSNDVENEVASETGGASDLENHQGDDAIFVYSSGDDEVSSTTNHPTDQQILAEGNNRGRADKLIYSGPWKADETWWHQTKQYTTKKTHFFTSPGRYKFTTKTGADTFRQIVQNEANGNEVIAIQIFVRQSHKGFYGEVSEGKDKKQRLLHIP